MCYVGMWLKSQMFAIHEIAHDDGVIMILNKKSVKRTET